MKILFFCGSLAPGCDGVGDYTRRLAGELVARGHECTVIALHDPGVPRASDLASGDVHLIRLPSSEPWPDRIACAIRHLKRFAPDWISWQLVAYGFHPRGFLPAALLRNAPDLRGPRCHVMLHELWLGLEVGAGLKARLIGWLQRRGVFCLLEGLDPDCVQTTNATYRRALMSEGVEAEVMGLFGNIMIEEDSEERPPALARWLNASATIPPTAPLVAMTFGTLHPQWNPTATVDWFVATARRLARPPAIIAVGRTGSHGTAILEAFRRQGVVVAETGELDAADISHLLRAADFGIAAHPWALIGKSGAAAAMLEHGLPVLVPRDEWRLRGTPEIPSAPHDSLLEHLAGLDEGRTDRWLAAGRPPESFLPRTADAFLTALENASPTSQSLQS